MGICYCNTSNEVVLNSTKRLDLSTFPVYLEYTKLIPETFYKTGPGSHKNLLSWALFSFLYRFNFILSTLLIFPCMSNQQYDEYFSLPLFANTLVKTEDLLEIQCKIWVRMQRRYQLPWTSERIGALHLCGGRSFQI